jgi:hypothetical protein
VNAINLWELMTAAETNHRREPDSARGPSITSSDLTDLGMAARLGGGQELTLQATDAGWVIKVFSCYGDRDDNLEILIPKDGRAPVKVLQDRFGKISHVHD